MAATQKEFSDSPARPPVGTSPSSRTASPWYSVGPGIWELLLNGDASTHEKSVLQWYEPNSLSANDQIITHTYIEEVILVEGELEDLTLGMAWSSGAYAYRNPGMKHGPYKASKQGCLMFVRTSSPA
ncbi:hypothetical protein PV10_02684 [Exophiala mesophila]|uniref:ChrR-like cupin domain-containing protein n=1 Tax=Exophiala mesophila TaxID=212818 RepID=A0A0D1Y324_EXOME|nr:uncharacterized protein PV10_02684 [Exophiala mesophila]KIV94971.1 hypothetical protein PV10_02684 [Exophiala mesophila]